MDQAPDGERIHSEYRSIQKSRVCNTPSEKVIHTAHAKPRLARFSPLGQPNIKFAYPGQWAVGQLQLLFFTQKVVAGAYYRSKSNPGKQVHYYCQTKGRVPIICAAQMPPWVPPTAIYQIKACGQ